MKIVSWNVNGIRACYKKGLPEFIKRYKPDILCLQEVKAHKEQVDEATGSLGYEFNCWSSAVKKGYSGVATFSHQTPVQCEKGFGHPEYESEGRVVRADYGHFDLYNIYFPNGGSGEIRHNFKQKFLKDLNIHLKQEIKSGREVIVVGDYNVAHREIDIYDPVRLKNESGFLPEERAWFDHFLELGLIDTYRHFQPKKEHAYSWWSYREMARIANNGWRIDYICVSKGLEKHLKGAAILDEVEGSDHCPVAVELDF
jgi:exodeoxyribonuclease-3